MEWACTLQSDNSGDDLEPSNVCYILDVLFVGLVRYWTCFALDIVCTGRVVYWTCYVLDMLCIGLVMYWTCYVLDMLCIVHVMYWVCYVLEMLCSGLVMCWNCYVFSLALLISSHSKATQQLSICIEREMLGKTSVRLPQHASYGNPFTHHKKQMFTVGLLT